MHVWRMRTAPDVRRFHVGAPHLHPHLEPVLPQQLGVRAVDPLVLADLPLQRLAAGESIIIKCKSPMNVLKDTYDHSCY
jgi:hypothetical protein